MALVLIDFQPIPSFIECYFLFQDTTVHNINPAWGDTLLLIIHIKALSFSVFLSNPYLCPYLSPYLILTISSS